MKRRVALVAACMLAWSGSVARAAAPDRGRETRHPATAAAGAELPLDRLAAADRRLVEECLRSATLHRRLPVETVTCDADLLRFLLAKPEALVDVWRVLGISRLSLDPAGPGLWRLADGYGTTGIVRLLHAERRGAGGVLLFHGRGGYAGPLAPHELSGSCVVVLRHAPVAPDAAGRPRHVIQIDAFLDVDGVGLELVTRVLQPLIVHSAAANLHEISLFVSQFAAAAQRNPAGIARLAARMARTDPDDRRALVTLACGTAHEESAADAPEVETELAARWLPADEVVRR